MSAPIRILELRSVRGTGGGPEKTILQGTRLTDPQRYQSYNGHCRVQIVGNINSEATEFRLNISTTGREDRNHLPEAIPNQPTRRFLGESVACGKCLVVSRVRCGCQLRRFYRRRVPRSHQLRELYSIGGQ